MLLYPWPQVINCSLPLLPVCLHKEFKLEENMLLDRSGQMCGGMLVHKKRNGSSEDIEGTPHSTFFSNLKMLLLVRKKTNMQSLSSII